MSYACTRQEFNFNFTQVIQQHLISSALKEWLFVTFSVIIGAILSYTCPAYGPVDIAMARGNQSA